MDERPEVIRSQMETTRAELTDKLESLETRVAEGMQATGTAVSETYTSISGAVQTVSEALNFPLQVRRHPWLAVGGSFAIGYLAAQWTGNTKAAPAPASKPTLDPQPPGASLAQSTVAGALMGAIGDIAARTLPRALDYIFAPSSASAPVPPVVESNQTTLPLTMPPRAPFERPRDWRHA